jgi:hypothetical protein
MSFGDRLVRFCPYTTLKEESSASENPLAQRIRGHKTAFIYLVLAIGLMTPIAYSFFSEPQAKFVTLSDLEVRVVTDKKEYRVNETIKAALYVCNNNSYPVSLEPIREIYISGNIVSQIIVFELDKIAGILLLDYPATFQYISIAANSSQVIHEHEFVARLPGEFLINMLGASTTVNVIDHPRA